MKKYLGMTALAGVLALGGGWMLSLGGQQNSAGVTVLPGAAMAQDAEAADVELIEISDMVLGDVNAPVTVTEYGSFTCPHCANFHANQFQSLNADYIESGQVKFVFREVYMDRFGLWASMIARCGGDMRFFGIHDLLYEQQSDWIAGGRDPALIASNLRTLGISAGLDAATVDACMQDMTMAQSLVAWSEFNRGPDQDDVNATPTIFVNGERLDNASYDSIRAAVDAALAE